MKMIFITTSYQQRMFIFFVLFQSMLIVMWITLSIVFDYSDLYNVLSDDLNDVINFHCFLDVHYPIDDEEEE